MGDIYKMDKKLKKALNKSSTKSKIKAFKYKLKYKHHINLSFRYFIYVLSVITSVYWIINRLNN